MSDTGPDDVYVGRDGEARPRPQPEKEEPFPPPFVVHEWRKIDFHSRQLYLNLTGRHLPEAPEGASIEDRASAYAMVAALAVLVDAGLAATEVEHTRYDPTLATSVKTDQVLASVDRDRVHAQVVAAYMLDETRIPPEAWGALTKMTRQVLPDVANILLAVRKAQS